MQIINFKKKFAPNVKAGVDKKFSKANPNIKPKRCTVRRLRKRPIKINDKLIFYTGQKTKDCETLGKSVCKEINHIEINKEGVIFLNNRLLNYEKSIELAKEDGFANISDFVNFFKNQYGLSFTGVQIKW